MKNTAWKEQAAALMDTRFHFRSFCYNFAFLHGWLGPTNQEYPTDWLYHILYTPLPLAKELTAGRHDVPKLPADCKHSRFCVGFHATVMVDASSTCSVFLLKDICHNSRS